MGCLFGPELLTLSRKQASEVLVYGGAKRVEEEGEILLMLVACPVYKSLFRAANQQVLAY